MFVLRTIKHYWEQLKKTYTNGEGYHVHGAETQ